MDPLKYLSFILLIVVVINPVWPQKTNFINQDSHLRGFNEPQWFKDNIPFLEVPDTEIQEVYYYRFSSLKRHLRYTTPGVGYTITEFVHVVWYSQKFGTINGAAGHHIDEARWLRDTTYVKDYINFWAREGAGNQQYSEWIADSAYNAFLVNGDVEFMKSQQEGFVNNFNGWNNRYEPSLDLYFISPHDDAMEHSASSEQTNDGYYGGLGYRPSFNSEMYGNAIAIANIAKLNNDSATALEFETRAEIIRQAIMKHLWFEDKKFFYHVYRDNDTHGKGGAAEAREEIGFYPWRWSVPDKNNPNYALAWEHLFDPQGFDSAYGPTTCEQNSRWFNGNQTSDCCWWNGNSWPYSTGMTLRSLAAQIKYYAETAFANVDRFIGLLHKYAMTHYKNGKAYVAECHSPLYDFWVCDSYNHSEHYAHSTYTDNVLSDLIGIEPQPDNTFQVNPLVPSDWNYFIVESIPYHGHEITVVYDKNGTRYQTGNSGMQIFVNGQLAAVQPQVGRMKVDIPPPIVPALRKTMENYASNVYSIGYPKADASFNSIFGSVWQAVNGISFYDPIPSDRWTNFDSPNPTDWFSIDFGPGRAKNISQIKLYVYSDFILDEGEVDCPTSINVQYYDGNDWISAKNQTLTPSVCIPNDILMVNFDELKTEKVRLVFEGNAVNKTFVGFSEIEIWGPWPQAPPGVYEAEDGLIIEGSMHSSETASGGSYVGQIDAPDAFVEFSGVWVDKQGNYTVQIYYANALEDDAKMTLIANNIYMDVVTLPKTSENWGQFDPSGYVTVQVPLLRGSNAITLKHLEFYAELDKITILN